MLAYENRTPNVTLVTIHLYAKDHEFYCLLWNMNMKSELQCEIDSCIIINSYSASHDNWCTVGGDGGCRVGEVRAGTTSPMPDHKGFKLQ